MSRSIFTNRSSLFTTSVSARATCAIHGERYAAGSLRRTVVNGGISGGFRREGGEDQSSSEGVWNRFGLLGGPPPSRLGAQLQEEGGRQKNDAETEDVAASAPREVSESHKLEVQYAHASGTLGYGFSAGGFLYCYHLGILWELERLGLVKVGGPTLMAGASAGSLAIVTFNSGLKEKEATKALREFAADCRSRGTGGRLSELGLVDIADE
jgi:hypothetical protein